MSVSKISVRKPVTVLIIFVLLVVLGVNASRHLPLEMIPDMDIPYIMISTSYANASPQEVEDKLTRTLESALASISGVTKMSSTSSEGSSVITLEFDIDTNLDEAGNTIRDRIDMVRNYLPEDASSPLVVRLDPSMMPVMALAITSDVRSADELKELTDNVVAPRIEQIDGVASTSTIGGRERAIRVEIPKDRLKAYNLTFSQIAQMIAAQNTSTAAGNITENGIQYSVQSDGLFHSIEEIGETVISYQTGSDRQIRQIKLADIAQITDSYKDASSYASINGREGIALTISKQSGSNTVKASNAVKAKIKEIEKVLPDDCSVSVVYDSSSMITMSLKEVGKSALEGAVLAILILLVFLRSGKSTLIIGISIPVSIIVTLMGMYYCGFTLNLMTIAGLALGIGMLVDNSIVVLENIYSYRERGVKPTVASVLGSEEMISAITSSTLTTVCVFIPMLLYRNELGLVGEVFGELALTVVISLLVSLVVAITLVPALTSHYLVAKDIKSRKFYSKTEKIFKGLDNGYAAAVRWILKHKIVFILLIVAVFVLSCMAIPQIGFTYMPESEETSITVSIELSEGTALDVTDETAKRFTALMDSQFSEPVVNLTMVGGGLTSFMSSSGGNSNTATVMYMFDGCKTENAADTRVKIEKLRELFPEASISIEDSDVTSSLGGSSGIDIEISSMDLDACRDSANSVVSILKSKADSMLKDISSDMSDGLPQLSLVFDREKMYALGINVYSASSEIKANVGGMTCARYKDGGDDVDIVLSVPQYDRAGQDDIDDIVVSSSFAGLVPVSAFAKVTETHSPLAIKRENQSRVIHVTAKIADGYSLDHVQKEIEKILDENLPASDDVFVNYGGDYESMIKILKTFIEIIAMAVLMVFAIMAALFESFRKPFIVLFSIPLAIVGIVVLNLPTGQPFNVMTAVGALILVGIVVNNGIVLVDYIGLLQKRGYTLFDSCVEAARSRLRPILMTTLTTVLALLPMAFGTGQGASMTKPIGLTVFGGLTFSTLMTLFMMPVLYYAFNIRSEKKALREKAREAAKALKEDEYEKD